MTSGVVLSASSRRGEQSEEAGGERRLGEVDTSLRHRWEIREQRAVPARSASASRTRRGVLETEDR
jgi:hypothetical protein